MSTNDSQILRECPFCGGEADEYEGDYGNGIYCMQCGAMVGEPIHLGFNVAERVRYEQAIEAWNTRAERTCHAELNDSRNAVICSECGSSELLRDWCEMMTWQGDTRIASFTTYNYCPNCGARVEAVGE